MNFKGKREGTTLGGPMVKDLPSSMEDTGSIPSQGTKIPHAVPCATPRESPHAAMKTQCGQSKNKHTQKMRGKRKTRFVGAPWSRLLDTRLSVKGGRTEDGDRWPSDQCWLQGRGSSLCLSPVVCDCPLRAPLLCSLSLSPLRPCFL